MGQVRLVVVAGRGESREVVLGVGGRWVRCQAGGRLAPGAGVGCGAGWAGGGQKKPRQALEARGLWHAERTVLPAVAQSKKGGGGWWARSGRGPSLGAAYVARRWRLGERDGARVWQAEGCRARRVGDVGCGSSSVRGSESGSGVGGVWWWWVCPATGVLLRGSDEGVDCLQTEAGEPRAGEWGIGGGLSPDGMAGVPWGPVGAEAPHVGWVRNHGPYFRHRSS